VTSDLTPSEVEQGLRTWMESQPGFRAFGYKVYVAPERFWPGSDAFSVEGIEELDRERECEAVALEASRRFGLGVVYGAVLPEGFDRPAWHCWNFDYGTRRAVDAANRRRVGLGYLGKLLTDVEVERLERASDPLASLRDTGDRLGALGRGLAAALFD
jgi:hypothetical protein